jgi:hypothetical protein
VGGERPGILDAQVRLAGIQDLPLKDQRRGVVADCAQASNDFDRTVTRGVSAAWVCGNSAAMTGHAATKYPAMLRPADCKSRGRWAAPGRWDALWSRLGIGKEMRRLLKGR